MAAAQGLENFKPNKPESFDGLRDLLIFSTWLNKFEHYLVLVKLRNSAVPLYEGNKILYAFTFMIETATVWWYKLAQENTFPTTWADLKADVIAELFSHDHVCRARDRLRKLCQTTSVSK